MKRILNRFNIPITIIASMLVSGGLFIDLDINKGYENIFYNDTGIIALIAVFMNYYFIKKIEHVNDKRMKTCASILSAILSACTIIGISFNMYDSFDAILANKINMLKGIVKLFAYLVLYYELLVYAFSKLNGIDIKDKKTIINTSKKSFFITTLIIYICYLPYFLYYYPGLYHYDSFSSIAQSFGIIPLTNHHPVFYTGIVSIFMKYGELVGNINEGIALCSVLQMLAMAMTFSYILHYMSKYKIDYRIRIFSLLFFALLPMNATYSISFLKDTPFVIAMTIMLVEIIKMVVEKSEYFQRKRNLVIFTVSTLLTILLRNNGIYVVIISLPFLLLFNKKSFSKIALCFVIVFGIYGIYKGPIFSFLDAKNGSSREALSIPLQQFARITKYHKDELTDEQIAVINKYLDYESLENSYNGRVADPVKNNFKDDNFSEDKASLFKQYFEFFKKYPRETFESFIDNNFGYYYPEVIYWKMLREPLDPKGTVVDGLGIKWTPIINLKILYYVIIALNYADLSYITVLINPGLQFWLLLFCLFYSIYVKKYSNIIMYIPLFALWLTCLAGPVNTMFRYIYPLYTVLPFFVGLLFDKPAIKLLKEGSTSK